MTEKDLTTVDLLGPLRASLIDAEWSRAQRTGVTSHKRCPDCEHRIFDHSRAFGDRPMSKTWAELKVEAALAVLTSGRRLIWTDDGEVDAGRRLYPGIAAAEADGRALLIQPVSRLGLQPGHLGLIEAFAASVPDVASLTKEIR